MNSVWCRILSLVVLCAGQAFSSGYILEMKLGSTPGPLASKYLFTVQKSWQSTSHASFLIETLTPLTATQQKALQSEQDVLEVEANQQLTAERTSTSLETGVEQLTEQLIPRPAVSFHGAMVRASYVDQPAARIVGLGKAQTQFPLGNNVIVAIIDTGVDENHPALRQSLIPGYDFTRDRAGTASELADLDQSTVAILDQSTVAILDGKQYPARLNQSTVAILDQSTVAILDGRLPRAFGHGTMIAGLVHLVAPSARILPLKAFRADGSSELSNIVRAIYYAVNHGANVINMSFSFDVPSTELATAVAYATSKGVLISASSGNDGKEKNVYPARLPKVLGIASTNYSDKRSSFSNWGEASRAAAPGEAVITTFPGNNYAGAWGTSFSTAIVSGTLAVMRQMDSSFSYSRAKDVFEKGVDVSGDIGHRLYLPSNFSACSYSGK